MIRRVQAHPFTSYALALLLAVGAFEAEIWLRHAGLDRDLFVLSYGAVFLSAWLGGLGPALLAIAVSSLLTAVLFAASAQAVSPALDDPLRIGIFVVIALLTSKLVSDERRARGQSEAALEKRAALMSTISHDL